jgi:hypothetical protein
VAARKPKAQRKSGLLIDVARVLSVGRDRASGKATCGFVTSRAGSWRCGCGPGSSARWRMGSWGWRRRWRSGADRPLGLTWIHRRGGARCLNADWAVV